MSKNGKSAPAKKPAKVAHKKPCDELPGNVPMEEEFAAIPGVTHYFPIALGGKTGSPGGCPVTGVYLPKAFKPGAAVDVVLFFHGSKQGWTTVHDFWKPGNDNGIKLRQAVHASGKNVILVAPTMGSHPGGSLRNTGDLDTKGADDFLDAVWVALAEADPAFRSAHPRVGRIALAAHSGGGEPMLQQWMLMKKYGANVRSVWGFDSTYGFAATAKLGTGSNAGNWIWWAAGRYDTEFHFYYKTGTGPEAVAKAIDAMATGKAPLPGSPKTYGTLRNVHVWPSSEGHYAQLNNNFPIRMSSRTTPFPP